MITHNFFNWCIKAHADTNQYYDEYLPYEFHLRLVHKVAKQFEHIWKHPIYTFSVIECGCFSHDIIEDARKSYNDVFKAAVKEFSEFTDGEKISRHIADLTFALSTEKGKNRNERANDKYYEGIRNTDGATFIKLCDRIANVEYGLLTNSEMPKIYRKEQSHFKENLYTEEYKEMWDYLDSLFLKA